MAIGNSANWYYDESVRVGSFTHQAEIKGIFRGKPNVLRPSSRPMPLPETAQEPDIRSNGNDARGLTVDNDLARQRIMGLIVVPEPFRPSTRRPTWATAISSGYFPANDGASQCSACTASRSTWTRG